jgi:hypothetical protein
MISGKASHHGDPVPGSGRSDAVSAIKGTLEGHAGAISRRPEEALTSASPKSRESLKKTQVYA